MRQLCAVRIASCNHCGNCDPLYSNYVHFNIYLVELPTSASESIVEESKLQNTTLEPSEVAMSQSLDTSCTKPSGMLSCFPMCLPMTYYQS